MSTTSNKKGSGTRRKVSSTSSGSRRQTGSKTTQSVKMSAAQRARIRRRKKQQAPDYKMIAMIGVILILVIAGAVFAIQYGKGKKDAVATTSESETELQKAVSVDGISITGMSKEVARTKLLEHYEWGMNVTYEGAEAPYEVPNLMEGKVDALLDEIFKGQPKESYQLSVDGLEETVTNEVAAIAKKWDVPAQNGAIAGFDNQTGKFIYSGERTGKIINQEQLILDMNQALSDKQFQASLTATGAEVAPEITEAEAKEMYKVTGVMTTNTTGNKDRNTNIQLAAAALNGMIIQPGQEFSFNATTGNRTIERGYKPAGAYVNGILVEEPGGGVCQVSSTLYNAVVFSGLTTTERHSHSYEPNYITPGEDAMVSYDGYAGPDMKFVNNTKDAIAIRATFSNQKLTTSIVAIPVLKDGEKWYMKSKKVAELDPPPPTYEENQSLAPGIEKEVKKSSKGSRWETNLVKEVNGEITSDELFHRSSYKGKPATIQRNTSGVVVPAAGETTAPPVVQPTSPAAETPQDPGDATLQNPTNPTGGTGSQEIGPGVTVPPATQPQETPAPTQAPPQDAVTTPAPTENPPGQIAPNPFP